MADQIYDSAYFAKLRQEDMANRAKKSARGKSKFVTEPGKVVELSDPKVRGWSVNRPKTAGDELMGIGAPDALVQNRIKRPDSITLSKPGDQEDT